MKSTKKENPERPPTASEEKVMFSYRLHPEVKKHLKTVAVKHDSSVQSVLDRGLELVMAELGEALPDEFVKS